MGHIYQPMIAKSDIDVELNMTFINIINFKQESK